MMILAMELQPPELYKQVHELVRLGFPEYELCREADANADICLHVSRSISDRQMLLSARLQEGQHLSQENSEFFLAPDKPRENEISRLTRVFMYRLLCRHLGRVINPYGILTGVRPLKMLHRWLDQGDSMEKILERLGEDYCMQPDVAGRLAQIACNNRPYLLSPQQARHKISIYIGIPFCSSRCYYCSFPGAILTEYGAQMKPFLHALRQEIEVIGECLNELGLETENIYWGGGTPSLLAEDDLEGMFDLLGQYSITTTAREITVEAGRPDTLSTSQLELFRALGVNRICINPQTMQDGTLQLIGRRHSRADIINSVQRVRDAGIRHLNMDLIIGLPGEGMLEYKDTLAQILDLQPENITVHTLAVKKGSLLAADQGKSRMNERVGEVQAGLQYIGRTLQERKYEPYYLYRQKYMKANVENVGYALPGCYCSYNIQIMEERQTIIGLGGGAGSKFVNPSDWSLVNLHSPKDPLSYTLHLSDLLARKVDKLRALN
jgi:oxygen-independent coproporphyrinogen-3 oxidase